MNELAPRTTKRRRAKLVMRPDAWSRAAESWSWEPLDFELGEVQESLHLVPTSRRAINTATALFKFISGIPGIGTWNAGDREAEWFGVPDQYVVASALLWRDEDGDDGGVSVCVAWWRVDEGHALLVSHIDPESVLRIVGLKRWPAKPQRQKVWLGG